MGAPDHSWLNHPLTAEDRLFSRDGSFFLVGGGLTVGLHRGPGHFEKSHKKYPGLPIGPEGKAGQNEDKCS